MLDGRSISLNSVIQTVEAQSLFNEKKLVIIENLFSTRKKNKDVWEYLKKGVFESDIVLWEPVKIDGRKISWIKTQRENRVQEYNLPDVLFKFLDSIGSPFKEKILALFEQTVNKTPVELTYFMIVRQFRLLLLVKTNSTDAKLKETRRLQTWQLKKLSRQAANFSIERLKNYYKKLMIIDYQQKTGRLTLSLRQTLDIFLANL